MWEKAFVGSRCGPSCDNESGLIEDRLPTGAENINFAVFFKYLAPNSIYMQYGVPERLILNCSSKAKVTSRFKVSELEITSKT